jgi:sec-independent protein translocase protein TatC
VHYYQQQPIPPGSYIDVDVVAKPKLVVLSPLEGMIMTFKICVWLGIVIASPLWIYFVLQFVLPALTLEEKRMIVPFLSLSALFILLGFVSAYYVTVPLANAYLFGFNQEFALNLWTLSSYLNYTLFLMIANGAACEIGVILFMLVHYRIINAEAMRAYRKHMIVAAFIIAALLTPPDVLTQFMMAIPLIVFYELAILYAQFRQPYANPLPQLTRSDS